MEIRPLTPQDLSQLADIDATIESLQYLHVDSSGEGLNVSLNISLRPVREKIIASNRIDDELALLYRQIASGADEGIALAIDHDQGLVAAALGHVDAARG